jgi:hypothetical protein
MRRNGATIMKPKKDIGVSANGILIVLSAARSNLSGEPMLVSKQKSATARRASMILLTVSEFAGNKAILDATIIVSSCPFSYVRIDGNDFRDTDSAFLSLLTKSLGVTKHELYGMGEE